MDGLQRHSLGEHFGLFRSLVFRTNGERALRLSPELAYVRIQGNCISKA
jgi:hypothetical protein